MNNNSTNPNSSEETSNPAAPKTTNDQDFIKFGSKIKIKKTVFFTILTITTGFIIIIIGLCKALKLFQDEDKTIKNNNNNNNIPIYNNARIRSRNYRIDKDVTMGITIAVGGFFLILIGIGYYCMCGKNTITKSMPNVQVVVPSEIDPHGPQTQFTDVNLDGEDDDDDDDNISSTANHQETRFGMSLDPQKRSLLLNQHNANLQAGRYGNRHNEFQATVDHDNSTAEIIPSNQKVEPSRPSATKVVFSETNLNQ